MSNKRKYGNVDNIPDWEDLSSFNRSVYIGISGLKKIVANSNNLLSSVQEEMLEKIKGIEEQWKNSPDYVVEGIKHQYLSNDYEIAYEIESYYRGGILLSMFSFFEFHLDYLCFMIDKNHNLAKSPNEVKANGDIKKYIKYIKNVFKVNWSEELEANATIIHAAKDVRNQIAHQNYIIKNTDKRNIVGTEGLKIYLDENKDGHFNIEDTIYLTNVLSAFSSFFDQISKAVDHRYVQLKKIS